MPRIEGEIWYWYHNVFEPYYHIQLTIKYKRSLFSEETKNIILDIMKGFKGRYAIEIFHVGFDKNHVHIENESLSVFFYGSTTVNIFS